MFYKKHIEKRLKVYYWYGIDQHGEKIHGEIIGKNTLSVKILLKQQEIIVLSVRKKRVSLLKKSITEKDITYFTRQLAIMIKSGVSLKKSLETLINSTTNLPLYHLLLNIKNEIESGSSLNQSLKKSSRYFSDFYCQLINVGEQTGKLDYILEKLSIHREKIASLKNKIKHACYYPICLLSVCILITFGLLKWVIPHFADLFKNLGGSLPILTQWVINLSCFLQIYGTWLFIIIAISFLCLHYKLRTSLKFRLIIHKFLLKIPLLGPLLQKVITAQFFQNLGITFSAGISLIEGLKFSAPITNNLFFVTRVEKIILEVTQGKSLHQALLNTRFFSASVLQMVLAGEESGTIETTLQKITAYYTEEIDHTITTLTTLLEPLLMVILSFIVGGLILAMYLPIFKLGAII